MIRYVRMSRASHVAAFTVGAIAATAMGTWALPTSTPSSLSPAATRYKTLDTFAQALATVTTQYVDDVDERVLLHNAAGGLVAGLDKHSAFLSPDRYRAMRQDTDGEFSSVGITLGPGTTDDNDATSIPWPFVDAVAPGSPAELAGIMIDDRLIAIDDQATAEQGHELADASVFERKLRGNSGTRVRVTILRAGWPTPRTMSLVRAEGKVPSVSAISIEPSIAYISISRFSEATTRDVTAALAAISKDDRSHGLILDLRGDPGGLVDQAIGVADLFLSNGLIVEIRGRHDSDERHLAHESGTWSQGQIFILVDQGTASAAEIVAGALQDNHRAVVIGSPTYGKGSVQTFFDLPDGSGLKLTTARYLLPSGRSLEGNGITPDFPIGSFAPDEIVAGAPAVQPHPPVLPALAKFAGDPQFDAALQMARRAVVSHLGTAPKATPIGPAPMPPTKPSAGSRN